MNKVWIGENLKEVINQDEIGQFNLSTVIKQISYEYSIPQLKAKSIDMIIRDVYLIESKSWNMFIHLYTLSTHLNKWPESIPVNTKGNYLNFLSEKVDTGMENGSLVTFIAPMKEENNTVLFQILGSNYFASGSSVVDHPRKERKALKKAEDLSIKAFLKRGSLNRIKNEEFFMIKNILDKQSNLNGINPIDIFKVDEEAFERVENQPFDLTV